ncbi:NADH:quinone oxidoreductase [Pseudomonas sp. X10]
MSRFWLIGIALAPLLGATRTLLQAGTIAVLSVLAVALHQAGMLLLRRPLQGLPYLLASALLACTLATCLYLGLRAIALPLALALGFYPALISLHCLTLDTLLPDEARWRALAAHLGAFVVLCLALGACRQWLANVAGLHLASLAPGALLLLGLLLALYNRLRPGPAPTRRQGNL